MHQVGPLKNPVNDSRDMRDLLKKLGFRVHHLENADQQEMENAIHEFGRNLGDKKGLGLFYYAGHGMQVSGRNYLIPVRARIRAEHQIKYTSVDIGLVLDEMDVANNCLNIVILDACRDNPFQRSFRSSAQGLAQVGDSPNGTLIAYATSPGHTASDGEGRNSPYTKALLKYLREPGRSITRVFQSVRKEVLKSSANRQRPWETTFLTDELILVAGGSAFYNTTDVPLIV
ncbi:MAG: caspase family protein [Pseudomonadota bacterium]|nr:caspase family protein [Pseudomonadota bacterium]